MSDQDLVAWYQAMIDGRLGSAQYLEPAKTPAAGSDRNCGEQRSTEIVSGVIDESPVSE
jgi:hypothetical protein